MTSTNTWCHDHHRFNCNHFPTESSLTPSLWLHDTHATEEPRFQLLVGTDCVAWIDSSKVRLLVDAGVWYKTDAEILAEHLEAVAGER